LIAAALTIDDNALGLAAGVAFYAALSLAPLLLLTLSVTALLGPGLQIHLVAELTRLLGAQVGSAVQGLIAGAEASPTVGLFSSVVGVGTVLVSATGAFAELQSAMNRIWDVEPKPHQGLRLVLRVRLLSLGVVVSLGFLLVVSMTASAALSTFVGALDDGSGRSFWVIGELCLSLLVFAAMFALMFKVLPDVTVQWRDVVAGALVTAALFVVGKVLIGLYIGHSALASSYGAAGSLVAILVWAYYSAVIVFLGAEITQVWAARRGAAIEPSARARRVAHHPGAGKLQR
jgi:membrane protein